MANVVSYSVQRGGKTVATAVTLPNGRCVVAWPTSTIIYDSEQAARDVHIRHMGSRGERTEFVVDVATPAFIRGWETCYQDRCEGIPDASGPVAPRYVPMWDREDYAAGYLAMSKLMYGEDYKPDASRWQGATNDEIALVHSAMLGVDCTACGIPFDPRIKRGPDVDVTCDLCRVVIEAAEAAGFRAAPEVKP